MSEVLDKIRRETPKKKGPLARARAHRPLVPPESTQEVRDLLSPHLPKAVQAWVDGLKATKGVYFEGKLIGREPDTKERRECARAIVEYVVGKAIERSMAVSGNYQELSELVAELKKSPEAQRLIAAGFFESLLVPESSGHSTEGKDTRLRPTTKLNQRLNKNRVKLVIKRDTGLRL